MSQDNMGSVEKNNPLTHGVIFQGVNRVSKLSRFVARAIDILVAIIIFTLVGVWAKWLAVIATAVWLLLQDGLGIGQSIGKKIMGIRVVDDTTSAACSFRGSFVRNLSFALCALLCSLPYLWVIGTLFFVPLLAIEAYLVLRLSSGMRVGDVLAGTVVVDELFTSTI